MFTADIRDLYIGLEMEVVTEDSSCDGGETPQREGRINVLNNGLILLSFAL